ncbi:MAG: AbrB/MazE/SpoVT family DNA-binding domain-containing protein [Chloroflexi bacterium]|nr:AbrB/MazE/SpoVT family DNA-binding domain-containing protein [Chloroflexota bacterium]
MKEYLSTVTVKGQVTIPIAVRRLLGIDPHAKVAFVVEDGTVRLTCAGSVVQRTAGALKGGKLALSAEDLRAEAERAIAEEAEDRSGR